MNDVAPAADLGLLTNDAMRARRHPRAVVALWAWESVLALVASTPVAMLVGATWGTDPEGDGALWRPGALALADLYVRQRPAIEALEGSLLAVLAIDAVLGLVPLGALLVVFCRGARDGRVVGPVRAIGEGLRRFPAMLVLLVVSVVAQAVVLGVGLAAGSIVEAWVHTALGEARAQQVQGLVLLLFAAAVAAVGVVHDLSRAAVVRFEVGGWRATTLGVRAFRHAPWALSWSWAWRAIAGLAPVVAAAAVTGRFGGRAGVALVVVFGLHQAVVLARVALRASWLARALRAVDASLSRAF